MRKRTNHWCSVVPEKSQPSGPPFSGKLGKPPFPLEQWALGSASLVMPIGDPLNGFFYPTLTLMIDSFSHILATTCKCILRYIDAKEPIRENLLFLSPIRSRKGAYQPKTRHGERRYFKSGVILDYLRCK